MSFNKSGKLSVINFSTVASSSFLHFSQFGEYYNFLPYISCLNLYSIVFVSLGYIFNLSFSSLIPSPAVLNLLFNCSLSFNLYLSLKFYLFFFQISLIISKFSFSSFTIFKLLFKKYVEAY